MPSRWLGRLLPEPLGAPPDMLWHPRQLSELARAIVVQNGQLIALLDALPPGRLIELDVRGALIGDEGCKASRATNSLELSGISEVGRAALCTRFDLDDASRSRETK